MCTPTRSGELSVVVVNWNNVDELVPCLRSLYDGGADELQVIVVDNGSEDASVATVRREFPRAEVLETGANLGFAEGCNRGIARATAPWVFTFNNDATVLGDALTRLRRLAREAAPAVGMIQPTMVFKTRPHHVNSTGIVLLRDGFGVDRDYKHRDPSRTRSNEVFACTAGAALYRRAMLDAVELATGIFDRTFFMYYEDLDLGWRCRLAGWRAVHEPEVRVAHRFQASSRRHGGAWLLRHTRSNWLRTLSKNASPDLLARLLPRFVQVAARDLASDRSRLSIYPPAVRDGWRQRAEVEALVTVPRRVVEARWRGVS